MLKARSILFGLAALVVLGSVSSAKATEWGRFYHYPYSNFPVNYRQPFRSSDFDTRNGYPMYPQYMAMPPYFRNDLHYQYHYFMKPGNNPRRFYQGNHFILDVF